MDRLRERGQAEGDVDKLIVSTTIDVSTPVTDR